MSYFNKWLRRESSTKAEVPVIRQRSRELRSQSLDVEALQRSGIHLLAQNVHKLFNLLISNLININQT